MEKRSHRENHWSKNVGSCAKKTLRSLAQELEVGTTHGGKEWVRKK